MAEDRADNPQTEPHTSDAHSCDAPAVELLPRAALSGLRDVIDHVRKLLRPDIAARMDEDVQGVVQDIVDSLALGEPQEMPDGLLRRHARGVFDALARAYIRNAQPPRPVPASMTPGMREAHEALIGNVAEALRALAAAVFASVKTHLQMPGELEMELLARSQRHTRRFMRLVRPRPVVASVVQEAPPALPKPEFSESVTEQEGPLHAELNTGDIARNCAPLVALPIGTAEDHKRTKEERERVAQIRQSTIDRVLAYANEGTQNRLREADLSRCLGYGPETKAFAKWKACAPRASKKVHECVASLLLDIAGKTPAQVCKRLSRGRLRQPPPNFASPAPGEPRPLPVPVTTRKPQPKS